MCAPEHFAVEYVINPWMQAGGTVDVELAVKQWTRLREVLAELGHRVHVLDPEPGLPDTAEVHRPGGGTAAGLVKKAGGSVKCCIAELRR